MRPLPFGETVTVTHRTEDAYGDWTDGDTFTVDGCAVWPTTGTETIAGGMDIAIFGLTVLMPPGSDVLATDTCAVRGVLYDVNAEPVFYKNPRTGSDGGLEVQLKARTG